MDWDLALDDALNELEGLPRTDWQERKNDSLRELLKHLRTEKDNFYWKERYGNRDGEGG